MRRRSAIASQALGHLKRWPWVGFALAVAAISGGAWTFSHGAWLGGIVGLGLMGLGLCVLFIFLATRPD